MADWGSAFVKAQEREAYDAYIDVMGGWVWESLPQETRDAWVPD